MWAQKPTQHGDCQFTTPVVFLPIYLCRSLYIGLKGGGAMGDQFFPFLLIFLLRLVFQLIHSLKFSFIIDLFHLFIDLFSVFYSAMSSCVVIDCNLVRQLICSSRLFFCLISLTFRSISCSCLLVAFLQDFLIFSLSYLCSYDFILCKI